jgi:hypothetical protein
LFAALKAIRLTDKHRNIWIDALSIDQTNTIERNHQVQMMGNIYKDAERVVVWLGPAKEGSAFAMKALAEPQSLMERAADFDEFEHTSISALCERSYWTRVWVQQEIYLARQVKIYCGSQSISDATFDHSLSKLTEVGANGRCPNVRVNESPANRIMRSKRRVPQALNSLYIWLNLGITMGLQTSEPRDLIYAMLGISSDFGPEHIVPDYDKPLLKVYLDTIALCEPRQHRNNTTRFQRLLAEKLGLDYDDELQCSLAEKLEQASRTRFDGRAEDISSIQDGGYVRDIENTPDVKDTVARNPSYLWNQVYWKRPLERVRGYDRQAIA